MSDEKRGNAVIATTQRENKMTTYYKKYQDAIKARQAGQTTLYSAKMDMYYNATAFF